MRKNFFALRRLAFIAIMAAALFTFARSYFWLTDGFSLKNIATEFAYRENLEIDSPSSFELEKLNEILNQNFSYLGKGAQTYAFISDDKCYVLKLVKQKHYKFSLLEELAFRFPLFEPIKEKKLNKVQQRVQNFLASCQLCYYQLHDETALCYLHLKPSANRHPPVLIRDKLGIPHKIDLDNYEFLLQNKADLLTTRISALMDTGDQEGAQRALREVVALMQRCWQKGLTDRDTHFINNIGFIDEKAIYIDVGEFYKNPQISDSSYIKEYVEECFSSLDEWILDHYPELKGFVNELKSEAISCLNEAGTKFEKELSLGLVS